MKCPGGGKSADPTSLTMAVVELGGIRNGKLDYTPYKQVGWGQMDRDSNPSKKLSLYSGDCGPRAGSVCAGDPSVP